MVLKGFPGGGNIGSTVYYRGEFHRFLYYNLKNKNKEHYESRCTIYVDSRVQDYSNMVIV